MVILYLDKLKMQCVCVFVSQLLTREITHLKIEVNTSYI